MRTLWIAAAWLYCGVTAAPVPGVLGRFTDGRTEVVFSAAAPHFALEAGESIHPRLGPAFQGRWEGQLRILAAGEYTFNREMTIEGRSGTVHQLSSGTHSFSTGYRRPAGQGVEFRIEWRGPRFGWEPLPRAALSHDSATGPSAALDGAQLYENARCANCHSGRGRVLPAPSLESIGSRTSRNWIYAALARHSNRPVSGRDAADMAAALAARTGGTPPKPRRQNEVVIGKGGELFGTMGCVYCHTSGSLRPMGSKYTLAQMTEELLQRHDPSLLLAEDDAVALAAFLVRQTAPEWERPAPEGDAARGKTLLAGAGCDGCHQGARALPQPKSANCPRVPASWSGAESAAVNAYLAAPRSAAPVQELQGEMTRLGCLSCHKTGTEAPELDGAGAKLRTSWLVDVIGGTNRIRHGRELRMPRYRREDAVRLADALAKAEGYLPGDGPAPPALSSAERQTGLDRFGTNSAKGGMACIGCHDWGENRSLGEEGPQLRMAAERLRYDWYLRWMADPARILSGTSMPTYFRGMAAERAIPRINALWAGKSWREAPAPDGFHVSDLDGNREAKPVPDEEPLVVRWDMPEATPAAIAVGFPGGLSYCFDAGQSRLLYAWRGGFLDLTGTLLRKTDEKKLTPTAQLIGSVFWRTQPGYAIAIGTKRTSPPPRFRGYRLVKGNPEFRYTIGDLEIREQLTPEGNGLRRRLTLSRVRGPVYFLDKRVPEGDNVTVEEVLQ